MHINQFLWHIGYANFLKPPHLFSNFSEFLWFFVVYFYEFSVLYRIRFRKNLKHRCIRTFVKKSRARFCLGWRFSSWLILLKPWQQIWHLQAFWRSGWLSLFERFCLFRLSGKSRKNSHGKNKIPKREFFSAKFRQHAQKHLSYR